jgi:hypothetical protein
MNVFLSFFLLTSARDEFTVGLLARSLYRAGWRSGKVKKNKKNKDICVTGCGGP